MNRQSISAILSVAYKEFLHIYRDRRVLVLLLVLPPVFTLVFGHAFEAGEMKNVPALLINRDQTERALRFMELILSNKTFAWQTQPPSITDEADLLGHGVINPTFLNQRDEQRAGFLVYREAARFECPVR